MTAVHNEATKPNTIALNEFRQRAVDAAAGGSAQPIYRMFARAIEETNVRGEALDYGSGKGMLAEELVSSGRFPNVVAVDILTKPAHLGEEIHWISADLNFPLSSVMDSSKDLIVSCEVIEHLENPRAVVRDWFRILRPGGTLMFSTPNNESWRAILALLLQGHFVLFGENSYPAHITALLRKDMERIALEAGFQKPFFRYTNDGSIPKMPSRKWQNISGGVLTGLRFSDNILAIAKKPG
ncbi:MAG: methyltransferase domain-containing protein [Candidatus Sumerlaeota bacterium]